MTVNGREIADDTWFGVYEIHPADKKVQKTMEVDLVELFMQTNAEQHEP